MQIYGLNKLTLLDFPGHLACTLFTGGCNFRCPFCYNTSLVLEPTKIEKIPIEEIFAFLRQRKGRLEGICITGGEPTLSTDLPEFISQLRTLGYLIKLDTNGSNPDMLSFLLQNHLLDYVAMDIKNSPQSYKKTVGISNLDQSVIDKSVELLKSCGILYEFRTTVVAGLHTEEDFSSIGKWLAGDCAYYLQSFQKHSDLVGENSSDMSTFSQKEMEHFREVVLPWLPNTKLRGI